MRTTLISYCPDLRHVAHWYILASNSVVENRAGICTCFRRFRKLIEILIVVSESWNIRLGHIKHQPWKAQRMHLIQEDTFSVDRERIGDPLGRVQFYRLLSHSGFNVNSRPLLLCVSSMRFCWILSSKTTLFRETGNELETNWVMYCYRLISHSGGLRFPPCWLQNLHCIIFVLLRYCL